MRNLGHRGLRQTAMITLLAAWATCTSAQTTTPSTVPLTTPTPCPTCRALERLTIGAPRTNPASPTVGDLVELAFDISSSGHQPPEFSCPCTLDADASYLGGDEAPQGSTNTVVVWRRAARAGLVPIVLHVIGRLEHECYYRADPTGGGPCLPSYSHQIVDVASQPFQVEIAGAPAPTPTPTPAAGPCCADCNDDGTVAIDELILAVNISLSIAPITACPHSDFNNDGGVTIDELILAVNATLHGCARAGDDGTFGTAREGSGRSGR